MIFVYSNVPERAERIVEILSRYSLFFDFVEKPIEGSDLIFSGNLDPNRKMVYVPDPVPLKIFRSALIESSPMNLNIKIPYCVCENLFESIEMRSIRGLEIGTDMEGCVWNERFILVPSVLEFEKKGEAILGIEPSDITERRILRLLGKGIIDEIEAKWLVVGKRFLENSKVSFDPRSKILEWKSGIDLEVDGETLKIVKRLRASNHDFGIVLDGFKIELEPEKKSFKPRRFDVGKIRDFSCGLNLLFTWNGGELHTIDPETGKVIWISPLEVLSLCVSKEGIMVLSKDYVHVLDPKDGSEIRRFGIDGRFNQMVECEGNLILGSFERVDIYDISGGLKPLKTVEGGGMIGCWMGEYFIAREDHIVVGDEGILFPGGRIWDVEAVGEKLVVSLGDEIIVISKDFEITDRFKIDGWIDEISSVGNDLYILLKNGRLVRFETKDGLRMMGEIDRGVKSVRSCGGLYVLKNGFILELIPQKF